MDKALTTVKKDKPVVDCNNGWSNAALRLLVLLIPYWLLTCPGYMIYAWQDQSSSWYTQHLYGIPLIILFPLSFFLCSVSSYLCLTNKLSIKNGRVHLPPPRYGGYLVDSLTSVSLERSADGRKAKSLIFHFELPAEVKPEKSRIEKVSRVNATLETADDTAVDDVQPNETPMVAAPQIFYEKISVSRIHGRKAKDLLQLLERSSPKCTIDNETRNFLLGQHSMLFQSAVEKENSLEIHYHSHERIKNFIALIKSYESYFWKVYLTVCAIPVVIMAPIPLWLVPVMFCRWQNMPAPSAPSWYNEWFTFFGKIFEGTARTLAEPSKGYFELMMRTEVAIPLLLLTFFLVMRFARFLGQPNRLIVNAEGFSLKQVVKGITFSNQKALWAEFARVTLQKPKGTTATEQWQIAFHRINGKRPLTLKFSAIKGDGDREQFLSSIEKKAPHLTRDHELIETFKPAQKQSYTELWLQSLTTPPKRERLAPLTPGQILKSGRYAIGEQLGTGGQGVAYLATSNDAASQTIVVKELVLPVFVDKAARRQALEKFEREAVMLQSLSHPRVVRLLDYFIEDHRGYLVLEHIDGSSLRKLVEEKGILDQQKVLELAEQMCDILQYLHGLSPPLVHRDFTPDNLILNADGVLKLIDFNVAHQKEAHTTATVVGKHAYLPPEQFRGKPVPQSDIYAMGASLHFLLTGHDPEPVSVAHPILMNESVIPALDALIARATELDTKKRFASAQEILVALQEIINPTDSSQVFESTEAVILAVPERDYALAEDSTNG